MYDKKNHTYNINKAVNLDTIIELEFETLPEVARRYITLKAARIFQDRVVGSETLHKFNQEDEFMAYNQLKDFEADSEDISVFDNNSVFEVIDRIGQEGDIIWH